MQKANKAPDMGVALFTEASGALSMGWRCRVPSQEAGLVVWYSHLFQNFPQFIVIHTVKGFGIVIKAEIDVFLELSCFLNDPADVGNLISGSSAFSTWLTKLKLWAHLLAGCPVEIGVQSTQELSRWPLTSEDRPPPCTVWPGMHTVWPPWWFKGYESALQCRGHGFDSWSGT